MKNTLIKVLLVNTFIFAFPSGSYADTSTDKIVVAPMPKFTQQPITVESQLANKERPQSALSKDSVASVNGANAVKPVEVLIEAPAFSSSGEADSVELTAIEDTSIKPYQITPEPVEKRSSDGDGSVKNDQPISQSQNNPIESAPIEPYILNSEGPGAFWQFVSLLALFLFIIVAEHRYRLRKSINKP